MSGGRDGREASASIDDPVTLEDVRASCARLVASRAALRRRPWQEIVDSLGQVGARFLDPADPLREAALAVLPDEAGYSPAMAERVLDGMARDWTTNRLHAMVAAELEVPGCLDGPRVVRGRRLAAFGPALCLQIVAGSVPGVGVHALIRSLVVKAPTLLKPGWGDLVLPALFARGLGEADPELAAALEVVYWPGAEVDLGNEALGMADVAVVYGGDETVRSVRAAAPATTRVVAYHHRIGVAVIGADVFGPGALDGAAADLALAVAHFEQRGCVCPHVAWVEGGQESAERLGAALARALAGLEQELPSGPLTAGEGAALQQLRGSAEIVAAASGGSVRHGGGRPWTVVVEPEGPLPDGPPTLARGIRIRAVEHLDDVARLAEPLGPHLQTVGHAGLGSRLDAVAGALARAGASRIVPLRRMSFPPPWWLHDGRGPLQELVRWAEVEAE